ncbi:MAG: metal-dependent hydrolase [Desulfatibacillaceae bacterium]|nr:metal-dependent hydrolase [Desulfatibacillaceae bacterium]
MDTITQAYLGAAAAQALARPSDVRKATAIGLLAGALADADIFIRTPNDPLFGVLMHRHFTHALVFIPLGALLAVLLCRLFRVQISLGRAYLFAFAAYATHAPLDLCTSYGTAILWPFSSGRYAWDIISIIDPVFTGVLFVLIALCWFKRSPVLSRAALVFCAAYLAFGAFLHWQATNQVRDLAQKRGHQIVSLRVMPTLGNLVLWRSVYVAEGKIFADGVRLGLFGDAALYEGGQIELFKMERHMPHLAPDSKLHRDIERFIYFADGFVALHPADSSILADLRYALLPDSLEPLWGFKIDGPEDEHGDMIHFRRANRQNLTAFWAMLKGKNAPGI